MLQIICADSKTFLKSLPKKSIQCCITSPPYFQQRTYNSSNEIGNEADLQLYLNNLTEVFNDLYELLRDDGTFWLNMGDKYITGNLLGVPWQLTFKLKSAGWMLRSEIIWNKPNAMPSSVKNRPTTSHEHLFLFSKSQNYFYNANAIREPHVTFSSDSKMRGGRNHLGKKNGTPENGKNKGNSNLHDGRWNQAFHPLGRNKRTVWNVSTSKLKDTHFAPFPEKLVEPCMLAGSADGDLILDPFCGSGTVGVVAKKFNRNFIGVDSNYEFCQMARNRIELA